MRVLAAQAQEDLFSFEEAGRQSAISWAGSSSQTGRDYLVDELRYMRDTGAVTPSLLDTPSAEGLLMTPGTDDEYLMRLDSRPLADDGVTPGTAVDYFNTPGLDQQHQHPLSAAVQARYVDKNPRRAVVLSLAFTLISCTSYATKWRSYVPNQNKRWSYIGCKGAASILDAMLNYTFLSDIWNAYPRA